MEHMLNPSKTRRQVVNQLVNMGIVEDRKMLRKKRRKGERKKKNNNEDGFVVVSQTWGHRRNVIKHKHKCALLGSFSKDCGNGILKYRFTLMSQFSVRQVVQNKNCVATIQNCRLGFTPQQPRASCSKHLKHKTIIWTFYETSFKHWCFSGFIIAWI